jgi:hypothetical protein
LAAIRRQTASTLYVAGLRPKIGTRRCRWSIVAAAPARLTPTAYGLRRLARIRLDSGSPFVDDAAGDHAAACSVTSTFARLADPGSIGFPGAFARGCPQDTPTWDLDALSRCPAGRS